MARRRAVVALGANLGDRRATLRRALARLEQVFATRLDVSTLILTPALTAPDDPTPDPPPYLNAVAAFATDLEPHDVLRHLQTIEQELGRDRASEGGRWRPRPIDLDLIAQDDLVLDTPTLVLPHPRMHERAFVLRPMAELWPDWRHPILGLDVVGMLAAVVAPD